MPIADLCVIIAFMTRKKYSSTETVMKTRESLFEASRSLRKQLGLLADRIEKELGPEGRHPQFVAQLLTAQGIAIDKLSVIIRSLKDLEIQSGEKLEAAFVIIEETEDGKRYFSGCAPELPALLINPACNE